MKLEIMGFNQLEMANLGLGLDDAVLLRWFVDYQGSNRMKPVVDPESGRTFHWVNFKKVCEDLPIITKSDRWMAERFNKLVSIGLLEQYSTTSPSGRVSAFRIAEEGEYLNLISMSVKTDMAHVSKNRHGMSVNTDMAMSVKTDMPSNLNSLPGNNKSGDNLLADTFCSEVPQNGTPSPSPEVLQIPLNDKTTYGVTQVQIDKWAELYPAVDVMQQLRQMIGWCDGNPKRCKTRTGVLRFINSWLSREQDRGGKRPAGGPSYSTGRTPVSNAAFEGQTGGELTW